MGNNGTATRTKRNQISELTSRAIVREVPEDEKLEPVPEGYVRAGEMLTNIEELAAQARQERQEKCGDAINKVLEDYNCMLALYLDFGENARLPVQRVLNVPILVSPISR